MQWTIVSQNVVQKIKGSYKIHYWPRTIFLSIENLPHIWKPLEVVDKSFFYPSLTGSMKYPQNRVCEKIWAGEF